MWEGHHSNNCLPLSLASPADALPQAQGGPTGFLLATHSPDSMYVGTYLLVKQIMFTVLSNQPNHFLASFNLLAAISVMVP